MLRLYVVLATAGLLSLATPLWALPPCGPPGTITTVTAPDGDYLAAFRDYTIYPPKYLSIGGGRNIVAAPEYHSYYPYKLALGPQGRIYVADETIIYRLEADGSATRIVGVPQFSEGEKTFTSPVLQQTNVLEDSVAALDARIGPGAMTFDRQGRLYFVDEVNRSNFKSNAVRIARVEANGLVTTVAGTGQKGYRGDGGPALQAQFGYISALLFDPAGNLLVADHTNNRIRQIDPQGVVTTLVQAERVQDLRLDAQGRLYFATLTQVFRRHADGTIEHIAGSDWGDIHDPENSEAMWRAAVKGRWKSEERLGGYYVANGRPATQAPLFFPNALALDPAGALYIAHSSLQRIHRVGSDGILHTIAGNGLSTNLLGPGCLAADKRVVAGKSLSGVSCFDHIGDGGPALDAPIWWPEDLLFIPEGDLLILMGPAAADGMWAGGDFSHLRRICGVSEWMMPTAVEPVVEEASAGRTDEASSSLRLYPNPFNAAVTVAFDLAHSASVSVRIYDALGQQVRVLAAEEIRPAGHYQFVWDGRDHAGQSQASGTYLLVLSVDGVIESHKLTLLH